MRWLHLSDIHIHTEPTTESARRMNAALPGFLRLRDPVDEMFITGDFVHAGRIKNPLTGNIAVHELCKYINQLADASLRNTEDKLAHIHIVPGNHDLLRMKGDEELARLRRISQEYRAGNAEYSFVDTNAEFLLSRFTTFMGVNAYLYHGHQNGWSSNLLPVHRCKICDQYSIVYINTAIMCNSDEDRGSLILDIPALRLALQSTKANEPNPVIILAHHNLRTFAIPEQEALEELLSEYPVRLYLCGDSHSIGLRTIVNDTIEITMGSIAGSDVTASFSIGELLPSGEIAHTAYAWPPAARRLYGWYYDEPFNARAEKRWGINPVNEQTGVKGKAIRTRSAKPSSRSGSEIIVPTLLDAKSYDPNQVMSLIPYEFRQSDHPTQNRIMLYLYQIMALQSYCRVNDYSTLFHDSTMAYYLRAFMYDNFSYVIWNRDNSAMLGYVYGQIPKPPSKDNLASKYRAALESVGILISPQEWHLVGQLNSLMVHPDYRGKRYGSILAEYTTNMFINKGLKHLFLVAHGENTPSVSIARSLGFDQIDIELDYSGSAEWHTDPGDLSLRKLFYLKVE
ncbi:MAG: GNAT family N-acetyltransferase [Symbiobacteriaceae bacterium]|nr:GNAT family N-acetyltransferase [Symbiobacteriaceae bacterium]